jgi:membrane protein YdbS with pleckstrin-like domain
VDSDRVARAALSAAAGGSPESVRVFRAGTNYYKWCLLVWFFSNVLVLTGLLAAHFKVSKWVLAMQEWAVISIRGIEWLVILAFATSVAFTFFAQRLNYALRWYIVTDRSLRIRTGIVSLQELTMTFSNIQEIRVTAGPLQNLLNSQTWRCNPQAEDRKEGATATSDVFRVFPMQTPSGTS